MLRVIIGPFALVSALLGVPAAQSGAPAVRFEQAAYVTRVTNDQKTVLVPEAGQRFLWVKATASRAPQVIDLAKVAVVDGTQTAPLIGVDSMYGGDPTQFSMIAPARKEAGGISQPLEESRSVGVTAFAFEPGKSATLKINAPSTSVCLLFAVPSSFDRGQIKGFGDGNSPLPAANKDAAAK